MAALHDLTLLEQAAAIRAGSVSSVELVEHYLGRIDALGDTVGAFVIVTADLALDAAATADHVRRAGHADLPPLHGVPTAIKDLTRTAGTPTRFGSAAREPELADGDDFVVTKLRAAGLVSLGKTNTPEFGVPCYTEPDVAPPARTPWDLSLSAGGSSGGAAAGTAAGLLPAAPGSDGGGSIRIPASVCGLVGLKPTRGRISNAPNGTEISGLATHGPLARTVRDAAALLDAMSGPAPSDWLWPPPPVSSFVSLCDRAPGRLRIGRFRGPVIADVTLHPDCLDAYEAATALLTRLGHEVEDHVPTYPPDLVGAFETVWAAEFAALSLKADEEQRVRPLTRWIRDQGRAISGPALFEALSVLRLASRAEIEATARYDAVLTPTLASPPVLVGALRDDADPARDFDAQKRFTPYTSPFNMSGQPAISLPLFWNEAGLPIGVQFAGRPGGEATLLQLAAQLEAAMPWMHRRPACW